MNIIPIEDIPKAEEVEEISLDNLMDIYKVCDKMHTLCTEEQGVGLSAYQVGIPWKLFIVKNLQNGIYKNLIDCNYEPLGKKDEKVPSLEGCLSLRDTESRLRYFRVPRYKEVRVKGKQLLSDDGLKIVEVDEKLAGFEAIIYQHEIDHQFGILISDIGIEENLYR